jgi:hypothetical protein
VTGWKIFKQTASLATDANGQCDLGNVVSYIAFATAMVDGQQYIGTPRTLTQWIIDGYVTKQNHDPQTLTIVKEGYQIYQSKGFNLNKSLDLRLVLAAPVKDGGAFTVEPTRLKVEAESSEILVDPDAPRVEVEDDEPEIIVDGETPEIEVEPE